MNSILISAILLLCFCHVIVSEDPFCGNKCYGQGVVTSRSCHCDMACSLAYNDCCFDSKYFDKGKNVTKSARSLTCKRNTLVVNSCLKEWSGPDIIVNSCMSYDYERDPVGTAPVTSETTGITYSNYFCAICNGDAEHVIMWNIKVSCPRLNPNLPVNKDEAFKYIFYNHVTNEWGYVIANNVTKKMSFQGCAVSSEIPEPHESKLRQCDTKEVKSCSSSWKKDMIMEMCDSYTDPVFSNGTKYKNFYCATCNRMDQSKLSCGEAIGPRTKTLPESDESNKMSFSILLDINFSEGNSVGKRLAMENCRKGEIFDPFGRRCRNIVCGIPGFIMQNGLCTPEAEPPPP